MEIIDRYIHAVTQRLPHSQREEIAVELRGLIADMLDEKNNGEEATSKDVEEVLIELGHPRLLAQKYRGTKKYIIGPLLYDPYITILKIVLISLAVAITVVFAIQTILEPVSILDHFINYMISLIQSPIQAIGWVTVVFALMEHFGKMNAEDLNLDKKWKPSELPSIPDSKRKIKRSEPITNSIFTIIFGFILGSSYFGIFIAREGEFLGVIPFLNEETLSIYLPFIIALVGLGLLKEALKLIVGRWTTKLAFYNAVISILSLIVVIIMILVDAPFWNSDFMMELTQMELLTNGSDVYNVVGKIWHGATLWTAIILIAGIVWDGISGFLKLRK